MLLICNTLSAARNLFAPNCSIANLTHPPHHTTYIHPTPSHIHPYYKTTPSSTTYHSPEHQLLIPSTPPTQPPSPPTPPLSDTCRHVRLTRCAHGEVRRTRVYFVKLKLLRFQVFVAIYQSKAQYYIANVIEVELHYSHQHGQYGQQQKRTLDPRCKIAWLNTISCTKCCLYMHSTSLIYLYIINKFVTFRTL